MSLAAVGGLGGLFPSYQLAGHNTVRGAQRDTEPNHASARLFSSETPLPHLPMLTVGAATDRDRLRARRFTRSGAERNVAAHLCLDSGHFLSRRNYLNPTRTSTDSIRGRLYRHITEEEGAAFFSKYELFTRRSENAVGHLLLLFPLSNRSTHSFFFYEV